MSSPRERLTAADEATEVLPAEDEAGSVTLKCSDSNWALEVFVMGDDELRGVDVPIELEDPEQNQVLRTKTDARGRVRFEGLEERDYRLSLYRLDRNVWDLVEDLGLPAVAARATGAPAWASRSTDATLTSESHVVEQGDCIASLAFRYGLSPDDLWNDPGNRDLRTLRLDGGILHPGDTLSIPAPRVKWIDVRAGRRYSIRCNTFLETFRVRFLDPDDAPRAGLSYVLRAWRVDGERLPNATGTTDTDGVVQEVLPPDVHRAEVVLTHDDGKEQYDIALSRVSPITTVEGVKARLNNLGYPCGPENDRFDERARGALQTFQRERDLEVTGRIDESTRTTLQRLHGS